VPGEPGDAVMPSFTHLRLYAGERAGRGVGPFDRGGVEQSLEPPPPGARSEK
jgi:hypothetical protein